MRGDTTSSQDEALIELYRRLRPGEPSNVESASSLIQSLFTEPKRYDLAAVGRYKLNKKLSLRERILGRELAQDIVDEEGNVLAAKGTRVDNALADEIEKANISHAFIVTEEGKQIKVLSNGSPPTDQMTLTPEDIAAVVNYLTNLMDGCGSFDDIDHLATAGSNL